MQVSFRSAIYDNSTVFVCRFWVGRLFPNKDGRYYWIYHCFFISKPII